MSRRTIKYLMYTFALLLIGMLIAAIVADPKQQSMALKVFMAVSLAFVALSLAGSLLTIGSEQSRGEVGRQEELRKGEFYQVLSTSETTKGNFVLVRNIKDQLYAHKYNNVRELRVGHWYRVADSTTTVGLLIEMPNETDKDKTAIEVLNLGHRPPWLANA